VRIVCFLFVVFLFVFALFIDLVTDTVQPLSSRPLTPRSATLLAHAPVVVPVVVPVVPQVESTITNDYYGSILPNQIVLPVQEKGRPQQPPPQQQQPQQQQEQEQEQEQTSLTKKIKKTDAEQRYWTYVEVGVEEELLAPMDVRWLENAMKKINDDIRIINNDRTYGDRRQDHVGSRSNSFLSSFFSFFFFFPMVQSFLSFL
jgi:hypothetical protein